MMKQTTLILFLFTASFSFSQVTIGTGNLVRLSTDLNSTVIDPWYVYSYTQSIYLASEINASGSITSLEYALKPGSNFSTADENVDVWIGHTSKTSFAPSGTNLDWVAVSDMTQVLTKGTITTNATGSVLTILFSTGFDYNGRDNLVIAIDANETGYDNSDDFVLATKGPNPRMTLVYLSEGSKPNPTSPPIAVSERGGGIDYINTSEARGNITLIGISPALGLESATIEDFKIFPTVIVNNLSFTSQKPVASLKVYNLTGKRYLLKNKQKKASVNLSSLSSGVYIVKVKVGTLLGSYQIVKK